MQGCMKQFGDWGNYHSYRDYTFANPTVPGQYAILTVTGDVLLKIFGVCTTAVTTTVGVGTCSLGIAANVAFILPVIVGDLLAVREIWHDATPDSEIENTSAIRSVIITDGNDVTLDTLVANFTAGVIRFYYTWLPLSDDANVVNA